MTGLRQSLPERRFPYARSNGRDLPSAITLPIGTPPTGSPGLTLLGGGNTLTLNDSSVNGGTASAYGAFRYTASSVVTTGPTLALSDITLTGGSLAMTSAAIRGGAVSSSGALTLTTSGNVAFTNNAVSNGSGGNGGAAIGVAGNLTITGGASDTLTVSNSSQAASGGAIFSGGTMAISEGALTLSNNTAGGAPALYATGAASITADSITATGNTDSDVMDFQGNATLTGALNATGNTKVGGGTGGIIISSGVLTLNGGLAASGNTSLIGLIYGYNAINIETTSGDISLTGNSASTMGAAVSGVGPITIGNPQATVTISGNTAGTGGAIGSLVAAVPVTLIGNTIALSNNTAISTVTGTASGGGAIWMPGAVTITGALTASGNAAPYSRLPFYAGIGGAIYAGGAFTLNATGASMIDGNNAAANGGAIYAGSDVTLNATGGDIAFSGNTQNTATTAQANAIYFGTAGSTATFNAGTGNAIVFFDPIASVGALTVLATGPGTVEFDGSQYATAANQTSAILASTTVQAGSFRVDNGAVYGATGSALEVQSGATLGGNGIVTGAVTVDSGGILAPGGVANPGVLTIDGNLGLNGGSILDYRFGEANVPGGPFNDLTQVNGNLTLAGTINVITTAGGAFDPGVYRVFDYTGALTDNGLQIGTIPSPDFAVQTSVAHQVNLVNTSGTLLNFWDGAVAANQNNGLVDGGNGTWQSGAGANSNWTTSRGTLNAPWAPGAFAVFEGAPGTVTADDSLGQIAAAGMQFAVGGYLIAGQPVALVENAPGSGQAIIRVGDGAPDGAGTVAKIASVLAGTVQLVKDDLGTLVLTGANTYTGGTAVNAGALQLGDGTNNGSILGDVADEATLAFDPAAGTTIAYGGAISGSGAVAQIGAGTTILGGVNVYGGSTAVSAGTLQAGRIDAFSANSVVTIAGGASLDLDGLDQSVAGLANSGILDFDAATPASGTKLTVAGNYVGSGGTIEMSGTLNGGPTDTLLVAGTTSGTTTIDYTATGTGGTTAGDGILVVQSTGTSDDAFVLAASPLTVGNTKYILARGTRPGDENNWYLQGQAPQNDPGGGGGGGAMAVPTLSRWALALLAWAMAGTALARKRIVARR